MVNTLILTQGHLGRELLEATRMIVGRVESLYVLELSWDDGFEAAQAKTREMLAELPPGDEVLILTGLAGATPCNVALSLAKEGRVEVVTGVNLPMVVRLACAGATDRPVAEVADWIEAKGHKSIRRALLGNERNDALCDAPAAVATEAAGDDRG